MELMFAIILGLVSVVYVRNILFGTMLKFVPRKLPPLPDVLPTISVVVPSFNESSGIYYTLQSLSRADYPPELFDVTVVDDCSSDDTVAWIDKGIAEFTNIRINKIVQPINQGKQLALIEGLNNTTGALFVLFDSDVLVDPGVLKGFARELQDEAVGIVGASCGIYNANQNLITQAYASVFYTLHEWLKQIESRIGCVTVIDGKAVGFRREVYREVEPIIKDQRWLGLHILAGEDSFITYQLTLRGYLSRMMLERVNTSAPTDWTTVYKQQLRWRRSGIRCWFWIVGNLFEHARKLGPAKTISILLTRSTYMLVPLIYVNIIYSYGMIAMLESQMMFLIFIIGIKIIMNMHAWFFQRDQHLKNPIMSSVALTSWMFIDLLITTPLALMTLDEGGWGTRVKPTDKT